MKRIFTPTISGSDWQRLLGKPELHWGRIPGTVYLFDARHPGHNLAPCKSIRSKW